MKSRWLGVFACIAPLSCATAPALVVEPAPADPVALLEQATEAKRADRVEEAEGLYRKWLRVTAEVPIEGEHGLDLLDVAGFFEQVDPPEALALYACLIEAAEERGDPNAIGLMELRADLRCTLGQVDAAVADYRESIERQLRVVGRAHPEIANSHRDLSRCLIRAGRVEAGFSELDAMLQVRVAVHGETALIAPAVAEVARQKAELGHLDSARADYDWAIRLIDTAPVTLNPVQKEVLLALRASLQKERQALSP